MFSGFNKDLVDLPWQIQVALASGYVAYMLAYTGIRSHHQVTDTAFRTLLFGLCATLMLWLTRGWHPVASAGVAALATIAVGIGWRRFGIDALVSMMRSADISWSDDMPSAWAVLNANARFPVSQISVELDDGTQLQCTDTMPFASAPFGPCRYGSTGDIALYVDSIARPGQKARRQPSVSDEVYGFRLTYIPASRVRRVHFRFAPSRPRRGALAYGLSLFARKQPAAPPADRLPGQGP